jgi:phosphoglucosamine mutase
MAVQLQVNIVNKNYLQKRCKAKSMEKTLFGTDGIRGVAGEPPLDARTVAIVGACLGRQLIKSDSQARVLLGQDTRESGAWISATLAAALKETGVRVSSPGIIPTPGLAYLVVAGKYSAGVMISASHNPYEDNGIKLFGGDGYKLPDADELTLETAILTELQKEPPTVPTAPDLITDRSLAQPYKDHLVRMARQAKHLPGQRAVIDCANGAATSLAREVFSEIPYAWVYIGDRPDGRNINLNCGSLHLDLLRSCVLQARADFGVAFDGDADRALFVDNSGDVVDGDGVLLAAARYMKRMGTLRGDAVVGTVMTNLGLERALEKEGIAIHRTAVGDKYVLEAMQRNGCNLGGEQSGHIIFADNATTGDGLLTALEVIGIMAAEGRPLADLVKDLKVFPQRIRNIPVRERIPLERLAGFQKQLKASEKSLGTRGRIVVRYSGTELLLRIMVEAETHDLVNEHVNALEQALAGSLKAAPNAARRRTTVAPLPS